MDVYSPFKGAKVFSASATHFQAVINYYTLQLSAALREYVQRKSHGAPWIHFMQRFQLELVRIYVSQFSLWLICYGPKDFALAQIGIAYAQGSTPDIPWILRSIASYRRHMADESILDFKPDLLIVLGRPPDFTALDPFLIPVSIYRQSWWCSPTSLNALDDVVSTATLHAAMEFHQEQVRKVRSELIPTLAPPFEPPTRLSALPADVDATPSADACPKCAERQQALSAVRNGYAELLLHVNAIQDFLNTSAKESEAQVQAHFLLSALYTSLKRPPTVDELRTYSLAYLGRVPDADSLPGNISEANNPQGSVEPTEDGGWKFPIPSFDPEVDTHCNVDLSITNLSLSHSVAKLPLATPPLSGQSVSGPSVTQPRINIGRLNVNNAVENSAMDTHVEDWVEHILESQRSLIVQQTPKHGLVAEMPAKSNISFFVQQ